MAMKGKFVLTLIMLAMMSASVLGQGYATQITKVNNATIKNLPAYFSFRLDRTVRKHEN